MGTRLGWAGARQARQVRALCGNGVKGAGGCRCVAFSVAAARAVSQGAARVKKAGGRRVCVGRQRTDSEWWGRSKAGKGEGMLQAYRQAGTTKAAYNRPMNPSQPQEKAKRQATTTACKGKMGK